MVKEKLGWTDDRCDTRIDVHHVSSPNFLLVLFFR